ncbi:MAG: hypothetical protein ACJ741_06600 [Pyrinomonadaceae bacterium]
MTTKKKTGTKARAAGRAKRSYRATDKAESLALLDAEGGNVKRAARAARVPRKTLESWAGGHGVTPEVEERRAEKRAELSDRFEAAIHDMMDAFAGKIGDASLKDVATAIGILTDKRQLLKGQPTAINEALSDEERARRAAELIERGRLRLVERDARRT